MLRGDRVVLRPIEPEHLHEWASPDLHRLEK
jgi:hypothetical protein